VDHPDPVDQPPAPSSLGPWRPVADRVWLAVAEPDAVNLGLVVGDTGALLVDTGSSPSQGRAVRAAVAAVTDRPLVAVVVTHAHDDHVFGLAAFDDVRTLGHESVSEWLAGADAAASAAEHGVEVADLAAPNAPLVVAAWVDLGGRRVEVAHLGRGHTGSDLVVVVPDADLVFAGDLVESAGPPAFGPDSFLHEWAVTLDGLIGLMTADTRAVPGHGEPVDREFVYEARGRVASVSGELRRLAEEGAGVDDVAARGQWPYPVEALEPGLPVAYAQLGPVTPRRRLPLA
jgi:glyoxylase-like metal-dependent hydrolase (beta-lactamase superfamily II)